MGSAKTQKTIALDIDEVLYPFLKGFTGWHNNYHDTVLSPADFHSYYFPDVLGISVDDSVQRIRTFISRYDHVSLEPVASARQAVTQLAQDHEIVAVTARHANFRTETENYLEEYFPGVISHVELVGTRAFLSAEEVLRTKAMVCRELNANLLVDDSIGHVVECIEDGIDAILFGDYSWNQDAPEHIVRCPDWQAVLRYIATKSSAQK